MKSGRTLLLLLAGLSACAESPKPEEVAPVKAVSQPTVTKSDPSQRVDLVDYQSIAGEEGPFRRPTPPPPTPAPRTVNTELREFFLDPGVCSLPAKMKAKIAGKDGIVVPGDVAGAIQDVASYTQWDGSGVQPKASYVPTPFSIDNLVHRVVVNPGSSDKARSVTVRGAPTYTSFSVGSFADPRSVSTLAYSLDCSGYLTTSISANAKALVGGVSVDAGTDAKSAGGFVVVRAEVASPLGVALFPDDYPKDLRLSDDTRKATLVALASQLSGDAEDAKVLVNKWLYVVGWSTTKTGSFQGKMDLKGDVSAGAGVASVSATTSAETVVKKAVAFDTFKTLLMTPPPPLPGQPAESPAYSLTVAQIRAAAK